MVPVPDLPLCLGVLKHMAPLARGPIFLPNKKFYDGFLLMWCNFKFEGVLLRSDSRHNDRVDSLWECATFKAQARGLITYLAHGCICPKSGTGRDRDHMAVGFTTTYAIFAYHH